MIVYIQVQHFLKVYLVCYLISNQSYCIHFRYQKNVFKHPRDKDFVRFIWFKDLDKLNVNNIETAENQMYRLCHVLFGFSSSPFLLTSTYDNIFIYQPRLCA